MENNINSQGDCQSSGEQSSGVTVATRMGVIYRITNKINGKPYVGQTRQKLSQRIYGHKSNKGKSAIDAAIAKYGWKNFTVEIIEVCPVESLNEKERYWIAKLNSKAPNGYNLTDGGDGCTGYKHTAKSRAKISANHADVSGENNPQYGKPLSEEQKAKISASEKGKLAWNKGKKMSEEQKRKLSVARTGKKYGSRSPETCAKISAALKAYWARKKLESQNKS